MPVRVGAASTVVPRGGLLWSCINCSRGSVSQFESFALVHCMVAVCRARLRPAISVSFASDLEFDRGCCCKYRESGEDLAPGESTKRVDLPTVGHCQKSLNRVNLVLVRAVSDEHHVLPVPRKSGDPSVPWCSLDGTVNQELLALFIAKLQAFLVELPGCSLSVLRTSCPLLSRSQTASLVELMQVRGLIYNKSAETTVKKTSPFAKDSHQLLADRQQSYFLTAL